MLRDVERYAHRVGEEALSDLECSFVADSQRLARNIRWFLRSLVALAAIVVVGFVAMQLRSARRLAEATATQAELEQGRSALLHGEREALAHLAKAYRRGERSSSTAFMFARALQPRLAEQAVLTSSADRMWSAVFSPDGKQVVTADDQNAQVWDAKTYQLLFSLHHGDVVSHAVYSADGARLVTGCGDGVVRIWDPARGVLLRELRRDKLKPTNHYPASYYVVALSPNGRLVAGLDPGGIDPGTAVVWDSDTGRLIAELRDNTSSSFPSLVFSSDGRWLDGNWQRLQVFDAQTWALAHSISGPGIQSLSWDPTGPHLATGTAAGDASIWTIPSGDRVHHLRELGEAITAVAFSPDGRLIAAGSGDGAVQIWDAASAKLWNQSNDLRSKVLSVEFDRTSSLIDVKHWLASSMACSCMPRRASRETTQVSGRHGRRTGG